ncbi:MAG: PfkB family carbohydrate kinase [Planctomycetota bacterium]|nr:PfkB family carbohydrate kinase [Planctomycetota bacterium]
MASHEKILELERLAELLATAREQGRKVVHCHGVYDLIHIGHIKHLEAAKRLGDVLVVTITQDQHVNKGPLRPAFTQRLRAEALAALGCVDYVAVNRWPTAVETIQLLRPNLYVKGTVPATEKQSGPRDHSDGFDREAEAIKSVGGELVLTQEETYSSSTLINRYMDLLPEESKLFVDKLRKDCSSEQVIAHLQGLKQAKVLCIGETIVDEYQFCSTMGKANKDPVLAARFLRSAKYAGGILAVANHAANFAGRVTLLSMLGEEDSHEEFVRGKLNPEIEVHFMRKPDSPTIVKRRFLEDYMAVKLFEVYIMRNERLMPDEERAFLAKLEDLLPRHDVVVVADYGHGLMTPKVIEYLCAHAKFLAVNAQANAGNRGFNFISKYPRADYACIDEPEARFEMRDRDAEPEELVRAIAQKMRCPRFMLTMGKKGSLCYDERQGIERIPVFGAKLVDRIGAGDAVLAITSPCVAQGLPARLTGFIGNVVGAEACAIMGNERAVSASQVFRHISHLLK